MLIQWLRMDVDAYSISATLNYDHPFLTHKEDHCYKVMIRTASGRQSRNGQWRETFPMLMCVS